MKQNIKDYLKEITYNIIILLFVIPLIMCACMSDGEMKKQLMNRYSSDVHSDCVLVDITFDGETHQYVLYRTGTYATSEAATGSLSHWAGCKYCKEKQITKEFESYDTESGWTLR